MRRRRGKDGTVGTGPFRLDLDQREAEFWNRPPKQVHTDLQSPVNWPLAAVVAADKEGRLSRKQEADLLRSVKPFRLPENERQRVQRVQEVLASCSDAERDFVSRLSFRVVERWVLAPPDQRDKATDWIMACAIGALGPDALLLKAVQGHLAVLWTTMHSAPTVAERKAAKDRWGYIMSGALPNLRQFKESKPIDAIAVADQETEAHRRIASLRKRRWHTKDLDELTRKLTEIFSDWRWPQRILNDLAKGIIDRHSDTTRAAIRAAIGLHFGRAHTGVRDALAAQRRRAKEQRRREDTIAQIVAGKRRYIEWLTQQGLKPHPAVLAQLKNLSTIS